jgi:C4-dicarboxylate transporter, DctQ subunit
MKFLDNLEEWLIAVLMGGATLVIFIAVVHRYAAGLPIPYVQDWLLSLNLSWAQELCIYMFVWMAKFGAAYGVRTGVHVGVDVVVNHMPERIRARFILFALAAGALFTGVIAVFGANFVLQLAHTDQTSPDMELPMWLVYLAIPLGSGLMCFRFLQVAWTFRRTGQLPHHDPAQVEGVAKITDEDILPSQLNVEDNLHPEMPTRKG